VGATTAVLLALLLGQMDKEFPLVLTIAAIDAARVAVSAVPSL
jgi:hypothetical protein